MVNVVLIAEGRAFFMRSFEVASNSGEQYYQVVKEVKALAESKGLHVVACVGDNASGVQNGLARSACPFCQTPCSLIMFASQDPSGGPGLCGLVLCCPQSPVAPE